MSVSAATSKIISTASVFRDALEARFAPHGDLSITFQDPTK